MNSLIIRADGASRGNPGMASCGYVIYQGEKIIHQDGHALGKQTNNYAEYMGLKYAIEYIKDKVSLEHSLLIQLDSELIVKQIKKIYKVKNLALKEIYIDVNKLLNELPCTWAIEHIRREFNKDADRICNEILDR